MRIEIRSIDQKKLRKSLCRIIGKFLDFFDIIDNNYISEVVETDMILDKDCIIRSYLYNFIDEEARGKFSLDKADDVIIATFVPKSKMSGIINAEIDKEYEIGFVNELWDLVKRSIPKEIICGSNLWSIDYRKDDDTYQFSLVSGS